MEGAAAVEDVGREGKVKLVLDRFLVAWRSLRVIRGPRFGSRQLFKRKTDPYPSGSGRSPWA